MKDNIPLDAQLRDMEKRQTAMDAAHMQGRVVDEGTIPGTDNVRPNLEPIQKNATDTLSELVTKVDRILEILESKKPKTKSKTKKGLAAIRKNQTLVDADTNG